MVTSPLLCVRIVHRSVGCQTPPCFYFNPPSTQAVGKVGWAWLVEGASKKVDQISTFGSPSRPNGLPLGNIGNPESMNHGPKGQPLCLVDWTSRGSIQTYVLFWNNWRSFDSCTHKTCVFFCEFLVVKVVFSGFLWRGRKPTQYQQSKSSHLWAIMFPIL